MLINFLLAPLEKIQPWGTPGNPSLSWFGLTDGQYWMQTGESTLFEYSDHAQSANVSRYCEYQVVRLYEDLIRMLPYILEPVPTHLVQYMWGDTARSWRKYFDAWCEKNHDLLDREHFNEIIDAAIMWTGERLLDSAYLSPSANIAIWSDKENVHIEWDNRDRLFDGQLAWSAVLGSYRIPRSEFIGEIRSFHFRLMDQMSARVEQVLTGALSPDISIDLSGLAQEHKERTRTLDTAWNLFEKTDWDESERAIHEILST